MCCVMYGCEGYWLYFLGQILNFAFGATLFAVLIQYIHVKTLCLTKTDMYFFPRARGGNSRVRKKTLYERKKSVLCDFAVSALQWCKMKQEGGKGKLFWT